MQVSIEASEGLNRKLKVTIPAADYKKCETQKIRQFSLNHRFPGFRPGHVPDSVIVRECGMAVAQDTVNELIKNSFEDAIKQAKIERIAASMPLVHDVADNGTDADFVYHVDVEVLPELDLSKDLSEVEFNKVTCEITDADVEKMIDIVRKQRACWKNNEGAALDGDAVSINYQVYKDGNPVEGLKGDNVTALAGQGNFIPDFEKQLVGHKVNDEFDANVKLPENFSKKEFAGQDVVIKTKVVSIRTPVLPEINEEFISTLGIKGNVDEFRKAVRKNMDRELQNNLERENSDAVINQILKTYGSFELPARLLSEKIKTIKDNFNKQNRKVADETIKTLAENNLKSSILIDEMSKKYSIKMDNNVVSEYINRIADAYESSEEYKKALTQNSQEMNFIYNHCYVTQFVNFVLVKGKVTDKPSNFYDLTKF